MAEANEKAFGSLPIYATAEGQRLDELSRRLMHQEAMRRLEAAGQQVAAQIRVAPYERDYDDATVVEPGKLQDRFGS